MQKEVIDELKGLDIRDVLNELGISYTQMGKRINFKIRDERTPSCFSVQSNGIWIWKDFGDPKLRGTTIDLWACVKSISFHEAVSQMQKAFLNHLDESSSVKEREVEDGKGELTVNTMSFFLDAQKEYMKSRCIYPPPDEVVPVIYSVNGRKFYGLGMRTLSGGWVIRQTTEKAKNGTDGIARYFFSGKSDISFWKGDSNRVFIVEGMFDAASIRKLEKERNNIIILNSVHNYQKAIDFILKRKFNEVWLALDNDPAGQETTRKIADQLRDKVPTIKQFRYDKAKDLNEYLIQRETQKAQKPAQEPKQPKKNNNLYLSR